MNKSVKAIALDISAAMLSGCPNRWLPPISSTGSSTLEQRPKGSIYTSLGQRPRIDSRSENTRKLAALVITQPPSQRTKEALLGSHSCW